MKTCLTTVFSSVLMAAVLIAPVAQAQEAAPGSALLNWWNNLVPSAAGAASGSGVTTTVSTSPLSDIEVDAGAPVAASSPANTGIQVAAVSTPNPVPGIYAPRTYTIEDIFGISAATPEAPAAQSSAFIAGVAPKIETTKKPPIHARKKKNMKTWKSKAGKATVAVKKSASGLDPKYDRTEVRYETKEKVGTIIVDTEAKFLYLIQADGMALRWGVGVARPGFEWKGVTKIKRKVEWPTWTPPAAMRKREPWLPARMEGGPDNPLGARAMYLYRGGRDTLYRIHGTNIPSTIGKEISSGCIRLVNDAVADLYERTKMGAKVIVL